MTTQGQVGDQLLTVEAAAERMNTSVRFIRRLIAERRIAFVKLGRLVRIAESDIVAFIAAGRVEAIELAEIWPPRKRSA
jgi:excisionase family DNA binding protein